MNLLKALAVITAINSGGIITIGIFFAPELYKSISLELWGTLIVSILVINE